MNLKKIAPLAASLSLLSGGLAMPGVASAEVSANVAVSNMYLWRGVNLSPDGGVVSGGLDYANESGFYAGIWASSEEGGHETDVYLGFAGEAGDFSYDIGYIYYMYPEDGGPALSITDEGDATATRMADTRGADVEGVAVVILETGHPVVQVGIQAFIRVQLRAVTGQVEHLELLFMISQPVLHPARVIHLQIVQDQVHFTLCVLDHRSPSSVCKESQLWRGLQEWKKNIMMRSVRPS